MRARMTPSPSIERTFQRPLAPFGPPLTSNVRQLKEIPHLMKSFVYIALALLCPVPAFAQESKFDGTWSVSLVANGGLCGSGASSTLMVQNGSVRAGGSG